MANPRARSVKTEIKPMCFYVKNAELKNTEKQETNADINKKWSIVELSTLDKFMRLFILFKG